MDTKEDIEKLINGGKDSPVEKNLLIEFSDEVMEGGNSLRDCDDSENLKTMMRELTVITFDAQANLAMSYYHDSHLEEIEDMDEETMYAIYQNNIRCFGIGYFKSKGLQSNIVKLATDWWLKIVKPYEKEGFGVIKPNHETGNAEKLLEKIQKEKGLTFKM